jgi:hypothetical protein
MEISDDMAVDLLREWGRAFLESFSLDRAVAIFDSTTPSLPPAAARRVLECDINIKKADSRTCLFAQAGLRQQSFCDTP